MAPGCWTGSRATRPGTEEPFVRARLSGPETGADGSRDCGKSDAPTWAGTAPGHVRAPPCRAVRLRARCVTPTGAGGDSLIPHSYFPRCSRKQSMNAGRLGCAHWALGDRAQVPAAESQHLRHVSVTGREGRECRNCSLRPNSATDTGHTRARAQPHSAAAAPSKGVLWISVS